MLGLPEGCHPGHRQVGPGGRAAPPGRVKAKACLDPAPGRAHARACATRQRRRTAARRSEAGGARGEGAWRALGDGEAHRRRCGRGAAADRRRDEQRRRRAEALVAGAAGRERRPGEGQNRRRTTRRSFLCEESRRHSPEMANRGGDVARRWRQWWRGLGF